MGGWGFGWVGGFGGLGVGCWGGGRLEGSTSSHLGRGYRGLCPFPSGNDFNLGGEAANSEESEEIFLDHDPLAVAAVLNAPQIFFRLIGYPFRAGVGLK